jgi:hypothetical protein
MAEPAMVIFRFPIWQGIMMMMMMMVSKTSGTNGKKLEQIFPRRKGRAGKNETNCMMEVG